MSQDEKKKEAPLSIEELLALLRSEHGDEALTPQKNNTKPKEPDEETSLDDFEFDDSPIEANYLNYNRIGVGVSSATTTPPAAPIDPVSADETPPEEEEEEGETVILPWGEEMEETLDPIDRAIRQRHLERRGTETKLISPEELPPIEEEEEIPEELPPIEEEEEIPEELPPIEEEEEIPEELPPIEEEEEIPEELPPIEEEEVPAGLPREEDEDGVPTYDLTEGLDVELNGFEWKPKPRGKGSTTPIDDSTQSDVYHSRVVLPSRKKDKEFSAYSQGSYIKEGYKAHLKREFMRLQWLILIVVVAFITENLDIVGVTVLMPSQNPFLASCLSMALVIASLIPIAGEFKDGFLLLLHGKPVPESMLTPLFLVPFGYYTLNLATGRAPLMVFGFAFSVAAILVKLQTLLRYLREAKTFRVVSLEKPKRVLSVLSREEAKGESEAFAPYVTPDVAYYSVKRTLFVDDYFKMTNAISRNKLVYALFFALSFGAAALTFAIALASYTWQEALGYAMISLYFTLPAAGFLTYEIPLLWASFGAANTQAAIIGEAAFERIADEGVVSFADSDIFSANDIKLCNILLFRESMLEPMLEYAALVFDEINSSVATVIKRSVPQYEMKDEIRIVLASEGGLDTWINGKRVLLGSYSYLTEHKLLFPKGFSYAENGLSQLFVAVDGDVWGKFDFEYTLDRDSRGALEYLENAGYFIAIRSLDPNLTHAMLSGLLKFDASPIRLVKTADGHELLRMRKRATSPFVSVARTKSLMNAVVLSGKSAYVTKVGMILSAFSLLIGAVLVLLSLLLTSSILLSGVGVVLYQLFWILPILILTLTYVRNGRRK